MVVVRKSPWFVQFASIVRLDDGLNTSSEGKEKIHTVLVCNFLGGQPYIKLMEMEDYITVDHREMSFDSLNWDSVMFSGGLCY
jgi:hypothetical protein